MHSVATTNAHTHTLFRPYPKPSTRAFEQNSTWQQQQQQWLQREWFWSHAWLHVYSFCCLRARTTFCGKGGLKIVSFFGTDGYLLRFFALFCVCCFNEHMFSGVAGSQSLMRTCISLYKICTICEQFQCWYFLIKSQLLPDGVDPSSQQWNL